MYISAVPVLFVSVSVVQQADLAATLSEFSQLTQLCTTAVGPYLCFTFVSYFWRAMKETPHYCNDYERITSIMYRVLAINPDS